MPHRLTVAISPCTNEAVPPTGLCHHHLSLFATAPSKIGLWVT